MFTGYWHIHILVLASFGPMPTKYVILTDWLIDYLNPKPLVFATWLGD